MTTFEIVKNYEFRNCEIMTLDSGKMSFEKEE